MRASLSSSVSVLPSFHSSIMSESLSSMSITSSLFPRTGASHHTSDSDDDQLLNIVPTPKLDGKDTRGGENVAPLHHLQTTVGQKRERERESRAVFT
jgi:hypothetical protein